MPTVPTSPLRVVPQAPAVDPRLFTQVPSVQEGLQMFEAGAKLPLILENIKHEKKRIKMENSKLDFAMSEAGRLQEQQQRDLALADAAATIKLKNAEAALKNAQANPPLIDVGGVTPAAPVEPVAPVTPAPVAPLADETVVPPPEETPVVAPPANNIPSWMGPMTTATVSSINSLLPGTPAPQKAQAVQAQLVQQALAAQWKGIPMTVANGKALADSRAKLMEQYAIKPGKYRFTGDGETPLVADAIMVGDQPVALLTPPSVDVKALHENNA